MIVFALILVATVAAVSRVYSPWRARPQGIVLRSLRMPTRARLVNQLGPLVLLLVALGVNEVLGSTAWWVPVIPIAVLLVSIAIPARYTITTDGIQVGALSFRRWTEFSGLTVRRGRIRCKSISGVRPLQVWLPGRFHDADAVAEIRRLMRGAYKGSGSTVTEDVTVAQTSEATQVAVI